jgi:hypothetical protein
VGCGAAGPQAFAEGKDCLRSAAPLVGQRLQSPTANNEAFTLSTRCPRQKTLMLFNVVNDNGPLADYNFAPLKPAWAQEREE